MLRGIPAILPPELLMYLSEMGHGDRLVIGDANFPRRSIAARSGRLVRCDGHPIPALLDAILTLMPLDRYVEHPVGLMAVTPGDPVATPIWDEYAAIIERHDPRGRAAIVEIERMAFYEEARETFVTIASGEIALYANIILQKGVIAPD